MTDQQRKRSPILYIILVLILLLINGLLFYSTMQGKEKSEELGRQKNIAENQRARLEAEVQEYLLKLDQYKNENEDLNDVVDSMKTIALNIQKDLQKTLHEKNFSLSKLKETEQLLSRATSEIDNLQESLDENIATIDSMALAYDLLRVEYDTLQYRYTRVEADAANLRVEVDSVRSLGAILQAVDVAGLGVRGKKNGSEDEVSRAKRAEKLKICWSLLQNRLISPGEQVTLYVKIIGPGGITLTQADKGSGEFVDQQNKRPSMYTFKTTFNFENKDQEQFCVYWDQDNPYATGTYRALLYDQGFKIGEAEFELK
jgi:hypothetical protein